MRRPPSPRGLPSKLQLDLEHRDRRVGRRYIEEFSIRADCQSLYLEEAGDAAFAFLDAADPFQSRNRRIKTKSVKRIVVDTGRVET